MVTLNSCLIWQIICLTLPPNGNWQILLQIDWQKMSILARKKIIFSDEAHFDLGGYVSKPNCRIWDTENRHAYIEKPTHPTRVTVWCGFWSRGIIGPFFFEIKLEEAVTVNSNRYRALLNEYLFTKIEEDDIGNIWFQQDGAVWDSQSYTQCFAPCFWRSHYQPQS